ncbi:phage portal protein [Cohaesibacter intestini]|uniref:phage portal protein n=1 Tax=Cohaesibacter intestini TaxID=2211145 RepID=UPI000DEB199F|nr:phage portal protein [Cohaesibacter intestini]
MWPFNRKPKEETRSSASGFTAEIMAARESYISGSRGIAELTGTAQSCVSMWEHGLTIADVEGTNLLDPASLALIGRSLALRGEAVFLIDGDGLIPCSDWDLRTKNGKPTAYRLSISEAGGGRTETALAGEVLHFRIGCDVASPYHGQSPLRRAQLTAGMLNSVESALAEVFDCSSLGSKVLPFPEQPETDMETLGRGFRGKRGRILLRESVTVTSAGGPTPSSDWNPSDLSPDLQKSMSIETLNAARNSISSVFGVLPGMFSTATTGPMIREAQRHLAQWTLAPIGKTIAQETSEKMGTEITLDVMRPLQAFDAGGRARALTTIIQALGQAKESGIDPNEALKLVDWD